MLFKLGVIFFSIFLTVLSKKILDKYYKDQKYARFRVLLMLVPAVLFINIVKYFSIRPLSQIEIIDRDAYTKLLEDKNIKKQIEGMSCNEKALFINRQVASGLYLLPFEDLKRWNLVRIELAMKNKNVCISLWKGGGNHNELMQTFTLIGLDKYRAFSDISTQAIKLAINSRGSQKRVAPDAKEHAKAIKKMAQKLNTHDHARLLKILNFGVDANDEDSCWMILTLLKGAIDLPSPMQENFLRYMAFIVGDHTKHS